MKNLLNEIKAMNKIAGTQMTKEQEIAIIRETLDEATDMTNTAKSYWNKFDMKKRIDFLVGAGYPKSVATDLSSEDWDSLENKVQKAFIAPFNLMKLLGRM